MRLAYFQLMDRLFRLELANQTIRARARVPTVSTIFEGHFPGFPLMPGVLRIEAMARARWVRTELTLQRSFEMCSLMLSRLNRNEEI